MKRLLALLGCAFLLTSGTAFAQQGHAHGRHHPDAQMAKLHKMMPKYAAAQAKINAALEMGDLAAVAKETKYLLSTTADLKKSKSHKQQADLAEFKKIAANFEKDVKNTADSARKGDLEGAKAYFASAQKRCDACHVKFRNP